MCNNLKTERIADVEQSVSRDRYYKIVEKHFFIVSNGAIFQSYRIVRTCKYESFQAGILLKTSHQQETLSLLKVCTWYPTFQKQLSCNICSLLKLNQDATSLQFTVNVAKRLNGSDKPSIFKFSTRTRCK